MRGGPRFYTVQYGIFTNVHCYAKALQRFYTFFLQHRVKPYSIFDATVSIGKNRVKPCKTEAMSRWETNSREN